MALRSLSGGDQERLNQIPRVPNSSGGSSKFKWRPTAGERFGIIRFGSRTDLYLPGGVLPLVSEGQTMIGGETVIAEMAP